MKAKQILFIFLLLSPFAIAAQTNFSTVAYGNSAYLPQEIFLGDSDEVYQVGQCAIRGTINGEVYWNGYCYTILNLFGGDAPARANCFVVGAKGVIRKNEACEIFGNWRDQSSGTMDSLFSVKFFNVDTGFVVGQNGKVLRTFNNGRTWTILPSPVTNTLRRIIFTPGRTLYAAGDSGVIIKSTDAANSWTVLNAGTTARINDLDFTGNDTGYAVGTNGVVIKTTDAGVNWTPVASGVSTKLSGVDFLTPDTGFIAGDAGVIRKTVDGGASWIPFVIPSFSNNIADVKFRDSNNGYFASQQDFYRTNDGGITWYSMYQELRSVNFPTKDTGYIVGANVMRKTTDGGLTWSATHPFDGVTMYSSFFLDTDTGYACGYFGRLFKTTNAGASWVAQNSRSSALLRAIHFFNGNKGIAVGSNYSIVRTVNGGNTWTPDSSPNANLYGYHDLFFITPSIGYVCGASGLIRKTTDGGATFTPQTSGVTYHLNKIYFLDTLKGFAIGDHGTVLRTINGGTTWSPVSMGVTSYLSAIAFYDTLRGYIAGESGVFFETKNGGSTWSYKSNNTGNIFDITFYDGWHGFLVGAGDYRARYEPMKILNDFTDICPGGGYNTPPLIAGNIQIDTGNVFVVEMDTSGTDFNDAISVGAVQSDSGNAHLVFYLPSGIKGGKYKIRLRATGTHPQQVSVPTILRVLEDPVASITQSYDTLITPYNPVYIYQWRNGNSWIPGATKNYLVITQPGDYNVIVNYGCCNTGLASIHANQCNGQWVNAPAVKPVYYVCDSSTATLTASGASDYHWYERDTGGTVISSDSFFVTPPITTLDTFYVAAVYGACESDRMPVLVYKVTKPAAPIASYYEQCGSNELFLLPQGGTSFNWYVDSSSAPFLTNTVFYHLANPVSDTFYVTNSYYDCQSYYIPVVINIDNGPTQNLISGEAMVYATQSESYRYSPAPGNMLQWTVSGGTHIVYTDSIVVTWGAAGPGQVQVVETNVNGCSSDTISLPVTIQSISFVPEQAGNGIFIFPNPVSDQLTIELQDSRHIRPEAIIMDALGRCIKTVSLKNSVNAVSLKDLVPGIYFVKITDGEKVLSVKIILKEE